MVNSIVKQSIDLRLKFDQPPKITASAEICVLCGMLCGIYQIDIPKTQTTQELAAYVLANVSGKDDKTDKLINLLSTCQKESESMTDRFVELVKYGYDNIN